MADVGRAVGTDNTHGTGENDQQGHDGHHAENLGQNQVAGRVDTHDIQRVNLLCYTHSAYLRGNVRSYLAGEYQTHDAAGEFQQHDFTRCIAAHPTGHPRRLDVQLHLDADNGTDEERDKQHNADGVDT